MNASLTELAQSFWPSLLAGMLVAGVCALLGVFVILKRVVFIGITLSEMAACGITAALILHIPPLLGAFALTLAAVLALAFPYESRRVPRDAVLGVLFVAASSLSVLLVSGSGIGLKEVHALLYGDLILTSPADLRSMTAILLPSAVFLVVFIRPILYAFLDREAATVLGVRPARWELAFFLVLGIGVAAASKVAGALLVFCYLIAPPAIGLLLAKRLWLVMTLACLAAVLATLAGLGVSFTRDLPTNQTICIVTCGLLGGLSLLLPLLRGIGRRLMKAWHGG